MSNSVKKLSAVVRVRAVWLVLEHEGEHPSDWTAMVSIAGKIGFSAHTLNEWVKKAEVETGKRADTRCRVRFAKVNIQPVPSAMRRKRTCCFRPHVRRSGRFIAFHILDISSTVSRGRVTPLEDSPARS